MSKLNERLLRRVEEKGMIKKDMLEDISKIVRTYNARIKKELEYNDKKGIEEISISYYEREIFLMTLDFELEDWLQCRIAKYWRTLLAIDIDYFEELITYKECHYKKVRLLYNYVRAYVNAGKPKVFDYDKSTFNKIKE